VLNKLSLLPSKLTDGSPLIPEDLKVGWNEEFDWERLILKLEVGLISFHDKIFWPSSIWKLFNGFVNDSLSEVSVQRTKLEIEFTSLDFVNDWAELSLIWLINLELCVTPATRIPMIKMTIDNSIKEKAFLNIM